MTGLFLVLAGCGESSESCVRHEDCASQLCINGACQPGLDADVGEGGIDAGPDLDGGVCIDGEPCAVEGACQTGRRVCGSAGSEPTCEPENAPDGTICRPALGPCDVAETCTNGACSDNDYTPRGQICAAGRFCDGAGTCVDATCGEECVPEDNLCLTGVITCDGPPVCTVSGMAPLGTSCGEPRGPCESPPICWVDGACRRTFRAGMMCRPASVCHQRTVCEEDNFDCPEDAPLQADGTQCGDNSSGDCDLPDSCLAGACVSNTLVGGESCSTTIPLECESATCGAAGCEVTNVADGSACTPTTVPLECESAFCGATGCEVIPVADGTVCTAGRCAAGQCQHVTLSEVCASQYSFRRGGFVELYNPTDASVSVDGCSVVVGADGEGVRTGNLTGLIPRDSFYLAGQASIPVDVSVSWTVYPSSGYARLVCPDPNGGAARIVDAVGWGSDVEEGASALGMLGERSIERKACELSNAASMGAGDSTRGNAWDTDNNRTDFTVRTGVCAPQNLDSTRESSVCP